MNSHNYYLFLDTETSHKPEHWDKLEEEYWPYIVQASWVVFDSKGHFVKEEDQLVKADDYHISEESERIHGITESEVNRKGVSRKVMLRSLSRDIRLYKPLVVGHFIELDIHMIRMSTRRAGMKNFLKGMPVFCTMKATSDYINLPHRHYPQLSEIYRMLFGRKLSGAHNALKDARATAEVFFELIRKGEIDDEVIRRQNIQTERPEKDAKGCGLTLVLVGLVLLNVLL